MVRHARIWCEFAYTKHINFRVSPLRPWGASLPMLYTENKCLFAFWSWVVRLKLSPMIGKCYPYRLYSWSTVHNDKLCQILLLVITRQLRVWTGFQRPDVTVDIKFQVCVLIQVSRAMTWHTCRKRYRLISFTWRKLFWTGTVLRSRKRLHFIGLYAGKTLGFDL